MSADRSAASATLVAQISARLDVVIRRIAETARSNYSTGADQYLSIGRDARAGIDKAIDDYEGVFLQETQGKVAEVESQMAMLKASSERLLVSYLDRALTAEKWRADRERTPPDASVSP